MGQFSQFAACGSAEFRVQPQHVDRELDFIDDSLAGSVTAGEKLQVSQGIVGPVSVPVVDGFFGQKLSAKVPFHNVSVLKDVAPSPVSEGGDINPHVSAAFDVFFVSAAIKAFFSALHLCGYLTFVAAIFLFSVYASAPRAVANFFLATLKAFKSVPLVGVLASAGIGTILRTIQRIASEFLPIRRQVSLHHNERLAAFLAGKVDWRSACGGQLSVGAVPTAAGKTAILTPPLSITWMAVKRLSAIGTLQLDRHGGSPLSRSGETAIGGRSYLVAMTQEK